MPAKKYTLYFEGKNRYGHEQRLPIISLSLKTMDKYTSNYGNYFDLYRCLPNDLKKFIEDNISADISLSSNDDLSRSFFITDDDFTPIMDVVFRKDVDVLFATTKELTRRLVNEQMSCEDFRKVFLKSDNNKDIKHKYDFFKYLYDNYVNENPIEGMIDVHDAMISFPNLNHDDVLIAAIATDKDNLVVLAKKLSQYLESRRNLAFALKRLYEYSGRQNEVIDGDIIADFSEGLNPGQMLGEMIENLNKFKREYDKEYQESAG